MKFVIVLNSCITNRYHLIDINNEKSPFLVKFVYHPSNKIKYQLFENAKLLFHRVGNYEFLS